MPLCAKAYNVFKPNALTMSWLLRTPQFTRSFLLFFQTVPWNKDSLQEEGGLDSILISILDQFSIPLSFNIHILYNCRSFALNSPMVSVQTFIEWQSKKPGKSVAAEVFSSNANARLRNVWNTAHTFGGNDRWVDHTESVSFYEKNHSSDLASLHACSFYVQWIERLKCRRFLSRCAEVCSLKDWRLLEG